MVSAIIDSVGNQQLMLCTPETVTTYRPSWPCLPVYYMQQLACLGGELQAGGHLGPEHRQLDLASCTGDHLLEPLKQFFFSAGQGY